MSKSIEMTAVTPPKSSDLAQLVVLAAIWASAFQAIKIAVFDVGPLFIVFARVAIGSLALLPWALWRGLILPSGQTQWLQVAGLAILSTMVPFFLISWGELSITSAETALLLGTGPLVALILSHFFTSDDRLNAKKVAAVAVGFTGVVLLIGPNVLGSIGNEITAQLAVLLASFCYVSSGLLVRRIQGIPPTRLSFLVLAFSTIALLPIVVAAGAIPTTMQQSTLLALIYLGLFPTGLAYILRYSLVRRIGLSMFAHVGNLIPVFGVAFGAILLGEVITTEKWVALGFILIALAIARWGANQQ
ncbi:MAG: DMT family transporter [Pseudomonadota bacterium]